MNGYNFIIITNKSKVSYTYFIVEMRLYDEHMDGNYTGVNVLKIK